MSDIRYANIIIDISSGEVDHPFTYRIPEELLKEVAIGSRVEVPFGRIKKKGYVIGLSRHTDIAEQRLRDISGVLPDAISAEQEMIDLAVFMARRYGSTLNAALKACLPVKRSIRKNSRRQDPVKLMEGLSGERGEQLELNASQQEVYEGVLQETKRPSLIYGVTGSGKTLIYIRLIEEAVSRGKRAIVLIPEISLAYQTVRSLSVYFKDRISVLHSRLSEGERYEQYLRAERGEVDVVIGPRSAIFTPIKDLGLIVMDEEHEGAYRSDTSPRYDTREIAERRAAYNHARLVLGSATPSAGTYLRAKKGELALFWLRERAVPGALLPRIYVSDMRRELSEGNRSLFSKRLRELMEQRLERGEQILLFLNRRGYGGFVSCRSCGYVLKCPHCDVSLTAHNEWYFDKRQGSGRGARLSCHYCGYETVLPKSCPQCGSPYIAVFGTGTQKLEQAVRREFPKARILRMDADTTKRKGSHERLIAAFAEHKADILIGTQMIVKGHDFPDVTLVGIVAADLSLNVPEFDAAERTFQLITQAAGRSGRGKSLGAVVIQSYEPEHYAIAAASKGDAESFYERELSYRRLLSYPPYSSMLAIQLSSENEELLCEAAAGAEAYFNENIASKETQLIGPCEGSPYKLNDIYRKILYIKQLPHDIIDKVEAKVLEVSPEEDRIASEEDIEFLIRIREELSRLVLSEYRGSIQLSFELL